MCGNERILMTCSSGPEVADMWTDVTWWFSLWEKQTLIHWRAVNTSVKLMNPVMVEPHWLQTDIHPSAWWREETYKGTEKLRRWWTGQNKEQEVTQMTVYRWIWCRKVAAKWCWVWIQRLKEMEVEVEIPKTDIIRVCFFFFFVFKF